MIMDVVPSFSLTGSGRSPGRSMYPLILQEQISAQQTDYLADFAFLVRLFDVLRGIASEISFFIVYPEDVETA